MQRPPQPNPRQTHIRRIRHSNQQIDDGVNYLLATVTSATLGPFVVAAALALRTAGRIPHHCGYRSCIYNSSSYLNLGWHTAPFYLLPSSPATASVSGVPRRL